MKEGQEIEPPEFEVDPKLVAQELQNAKYVLGWLGAKNLSDIEIFHLRKDIEASIRERHELEKKYMPEGFGSATIADFDTLRLNVSIPFEEAVARFLSHYGINMSEVNLRLSQNVPLSDQIIMDEAGRKYVSEKIREAREQAHNPYLD